MEIFEHVPLASQTTLQLGGRARYFYELTNPADVPAVYEAARQLGVPIFLLGGGSNTIFADGVIDKLVVKNSLKGVSFAASSEGVLATAASGEGWDDFVAGAVSSGCSGVEALSGIPGTVGAAPVQNIGAYGAELADVLVSVTAWDRKVGETRELNRDECEFSYRDSRFKRQPGRFIITQVTLQLSNQPPAVPEYGSLTQYLEKENIVGPDLETIRWAILAVRATRLPDVKQNPNAGSFFTNPVISKDVANNLKKKFPDLVQYDLDDGQVKIPAGWLIERAGLKGKNFGNFHISANNALVLIHDGGGTTEELIGLQEEIKGKVKEMFGITLEREPNLIT
jgi:UDP-N-acetylmuramate dehydrogenase